MKSQFPSLNKTQAGVQVASTLMLPHLQPGVLYQDPDKPALLLRGFYHAAGKKTQQIQKKKPASGMELATLSTSVGLAMVEDMTPERTPQITLVSKVSSAREDGGKG